MAKRSFSFGMVALLIVMAVVLTLVARAWRTVAPAALDVRDATHSGPLDDHGQTEAGNAVREGGMPDLRETERETDEHAARVQEALQEIE